MVCGEDGVWSERVCGFCGSEGGVGSAVRSESGVG